MSDVFIIGTGMTRFGRFVDESVKSLTARAVTAALADSGLSPNRIKAAFFANATQGALEGQHMVRGQVALRPLKIEGVPIINVENACASATTAVNLAVSYIKSGVADVVLAVGVDKMVTSDKAQMLRVFDGAWDVHDTTRGTQLLIELGSGVVPPKNIQEQQKRSFFMDVYAAFAKAHMDTFGTTQRQIALASAKNHTHSSLNPLAQYQRAMTVDEVLSAPTVVWPYTIPMCAPVSDGAAALVLCSRNALKETAEARPIKVLASQIRTGISRNSTDFDKHVGHLTAKAAYDEASVEPGDISCAEVHDATAFAEIQQIENLMFAPFGGGGWFIEQGDGTLGGKLPVNPSGGLQSKGHPIGATGIAQLHELTLQLRGEAGARQVDGARLAIAENGGGLYGGEEATAAVTILGV